VNCEVINKKDIEIYIFPEHKRTVLLREWFTSNVCIEYVTIPRTFFFLKDDMLHFGHLDDNNYCRRLGRNYFFEHGFRDDKYFFVACLGKKFTKIKDSIHYFWESSFLSPFPTDSPTKYSLDIVLSKLGIMDDPNEIT